ncbi:hypothetical protein Golomagni_03804 [Golovinomyces magnicellulatus]|nr:hypothetical protein Golomagni_03804 [Golovinomyces magnicellulatus]
MRHLKTEVDFPNSLHKNFEKIPHPPASNMIPVLTSEFASQVKTRQARLDQVAESKLRELTQRQSTVDYYQDYDCPRIDTALPISQVQYPKIQPPQQPIIFPSKPRIQSELPRKNSKTFKFPSNDFGKLSSYPTSGIKYSRAGSMGKVMTSLKTNCGYSLRTVEY